MNKYLLIMATFSFSLQALETKELAEMSMKKELFEKQERIADKAKEVELLREQNLKKQLEVTERYERVVGQVGSETKRTIYVLGATCFGVLAAYEILLKIIK